MTNTEWNEGLTLFGSFTSSSSYKPMLYLALARLPFSFRTVNLKYGAQKEADYLAVNRYGQVPALRHRGLTIVQSNVILDYLARTTGHFAGETEQDQWTAREWLSWEADNITNVAKVRHYSRFREVDPAVMGYFRPLAEAAVGSVDAALAGRDWLVGDASHDRRHRLLGQDGVHGGGRIGHWALAECGGVVTAACRLAGICPAL